MKSMKERRKEAGCAGWGCFAVMIAGVILILGLAMVGAGS